MDILILIGIIAFLTSLVSGLLGLGGAVLLIPAYLYLPAVLNAPPLDMKSISGMTSVQVLSASLLGMVLHRRKGAVDSRLVLTMGIPITIAAFGGAVFSGTVQPTALVAVFGCLAVIASILMVVKKQQPDQSFTIPVPFNPTGAIAIAVSVGFFGGMVGAPGAFILSPLMMVALSIPTRVTIGSTLGIVLLSALATSIGKLITGQVPVTTTIVAVGSSLPGVYLGSIFSHQLSTQLLRRVLAVLVSAIGITMLYQVFVR